MRLAQLRERVADVDGQAVGIDGEPEVFVPGLTGLALRAPALGVQQRADVLELAAHVAGELEDSYYVLPFKHNSSFDRTLNYSSKWFENVFGYMVINPLETRILDLSPKKDKVLFGSVPNAVLITAQTKTGEGAPFFDIGWKPEVEKTQLYLGIDDGGVPERRGCCLRGVRC